MPGMTTDTTTQTSVDTVRKLFGAIKERDFATVGGLLRSDATWNHRNQDRFAGIHDGPAEIASFMRESFELTTGTLQPVPEAFMADAEGRVAVLLTLHGRRPDGRTTADLQLILVKVDGGQISSIDHFVGDPAAVAAFWA